jgi:hypothetical protein
MSLRRATVLPDETVALKTIAVLNETKPKFLAFSSCLMTVGWSVRYAASLLLKVLAKGRANHRDAGKASSSAIRHYLRIAQMQRVQRLKLSAIRWVCWPCVREGVSTELLHPPAKVNYSLPTQQVDVKWKERRSPRRRQLVFQLKKAHRAHPRYNNS